MTPPLWDFALTPEQGLKFALVGVNWAMADAELGHLIQRLSGIKDDADGAELVHAIDLRKKIDIIHKRNQRGSLPAAAHDLVTEMRYVGENYRPARNMLAHGVLSGNPSDNVLWSHSKRISIPLSDLDAILSEAQYAAHVAHHLLLRCLGAEPLEAPPPRPPARPVQP